MNEHKIEHIHTALHRYFDQARPESHAHNARLFQSYLAGYMPLALIVAPSVILQRLRHIAESQNMQSLFGADEAERLALHLRREA